MRQNVLLITGNSLKLTPHNRRFIRRKAEKLLRHESQIRRICIELRTASPRSSDPLYETRGIAELPGPFLVASAKSTNLYSAVELMIHKLGRRVRRRQRVRLFRRTHLRPIDIPAEIPKVETVKIAEPQAA